MQTGRRDLRALAAGSVLGLLALLLWLNRDYVSSLFASSYTATIHLTTTTEPDDTRLTRAFAAAARTHPYGAKLEIAPAELEQIRDSDVTVPGASGADAVARAGTFSRALVAAFDSAGSGHLDASVYPSAYPTEDRATRNALTLLSLGTPVLGLLSIALLWAGWRDWRAGPAGDAFPAGAGYAAAAALAVPVLLLVLPGWLLMALFAAGIPVAIAGLLVSRAGAAKRAANWPMTLGHIVHSRTAAARRDRSDGSTQIGNIADVEYTYSVGGVEHRGTRIGIGAEPSNSAQVETALARYIAGRSVPVYYNPANPDEAVLERDPPVKPGIVYAAAAAIVLTGFAVVVTFTRISEIIAWLQPWFPPGAVIQGVLFCALGGLMTLAFLLFSLRDAAAAARWPTVSGTVVASEVRSHRELVGGRGGSSTVEVFSPSVEYRYQVGGREYHGGQVAFGAAVSAGKALAEKTVTRYPQGAAVTVHYDPGNPSTAVLEPRVAFGWLTLLVMVAFFAGAWFFSGWRG